MGLTSDWIRVGLDHVVFGSRPVGALTDRIERWVGFANVLCSTSFGSGPRKQASSPASAPETRRIVALVSRETRHRELRRSSVRSAGSPRSLGGHVTLRSAVLEAVRLIFGSVVVPLPGPPPSGSLACSRLACGHLGRGRRAPCPSALATHPFLCHLAAAARHVVPRGVIPGGGPSLKAVVAAASSLRVDFSGSGVGR